MEPFKVVKDFEQALCEYTGAKYCVAVNSCTMALLLALEYAKMLAYKYQDEHPEVSPGWLNIPAFTYPSVVMSARHAGWNTKFVDEDWQGAYNLYPTKVWDAAPRFTSDMYKPETYMCVSFHAKKHLKIGQGGAILHDDEVADAWFRKARFDGRTEGVPTNKDTYDMVGWHCYMSPDDAARGLWLLSSYPKHVLDLPRDNYPDLRERWKL